MSQWERGVQQPFPTSSKPQKAFRTASWVSTAGGREKKSLRRGLNPLLQSPFGKLLVDKRLLILLGRTLGLVSAACHRHLAFSRQRPGGAHAAGSKGRPRCTRGPAACSPPAAKWAAKQALPRRVGPWIRSDTGKGRGVKSPGPFIPHPRGSSCLGLPSAG